MKYVIISQYNGKLHTLEQVEDIHPDSELVVVIDTHRKKTIIAGDMLKGVFECIEYLINAYDHRLMRMQDVDSAVKLLEYLDVTLAKFNYYNSKEEDYTIVQKKAGYKEFVDFFYTNDIMEYADDFLDATTITYHQQSNIAIAVDYAHGEGLDLDKPLDGEILKHGSGIEIFNISRLLSTARVFKAENVKTVVNILDYIKENYRGTL